MIITRFAPSPTGLLHVGNVRTAIVNWLFARANGGKFILRIDDTDKERSTQDFEDKIKRDLEWLGLDWDETFKQSTRVDRYYQARDELIADGRLYHCYETAADLEIKRKTLLKRGLPPVYDRASLKNPEENPTHNPHWRFLLRDGEISWDDAIRGMMHFNTKNISDPIFFKENGGMTYNLASVVDDIDYKITHIMRGEDHLTNTATHIQLFDSLKAKVPQFAHFALLYNKDGEISKRLGGFDIESLREQGIENLAISAFFSKMGTSDPVETIYSLDDLKKTFSLKKFNKAPVHYSFEELKKFNTKMIHHMPYAVAKNSIDVSEMFWNAIHGNIDTIKEAELWHNVCYGEIETIKSDTEFLKLAAELLPENPWDSHTWNIWTNKIKEKTNRKGKDLFMPLRLAITGQNHGPEMAVMLQLIGREKAIARLKLR